ncbi:putative ankyrin repeat protein [Chloropicon roscoffensis]|uniref:Ankyrin repeat protein n=1 Tax=Chloropicon roscoffensis TaxID=1461544 RepID=A0AAX4PGF6_9CHLO
MARDAGEPSAKRAKVDEANDEEEKEDPLVRRKEEVVRLLEKASAKGKGNARAKKELLALCAKLEAKNEKLLGRLPPELWHKIVDENVQQNDTVALALTCRFYREKQKDLGGKLETNLTAKHLLNLQKRGKVAPYSLGWFQWVCDTFKILPGFKLGYMRVEGAVYEGDLVHYAAFQGSVEILRWLMEEKGWEPNEKTGLKAGRGGSVEILEYLVDSGYELTRGACAGAAGEGHLEALKFLRGLDPPCPWSAWTCAEAAKGGHLDILKWLRSQDPPCPWSAWTCSVAAQEGHLEVLKWLRSQDPPCSWDWVTCLSAAQEGHLEVLKWLRSQDPPCRWDERTCAYAARRGHLDILKWARSEDPPCPWSRRSCREVASNYVHEHIVKWIDQRRQSDE